MKGRLRLTRRFQLVQEVGDIIGAKGAGGERFLQGGSHQLGAISAEQAEQFLEFPQQRAAGVGHAAQISFYRFLGQEAAEQGEQPLLGLRAPGGRTVFK